MFRRGQLPDQQVITKAKRAELIVVWFRREDYPAVLSSMDDAAALPASYRQWLRIAEQGAVRLARRGVRIVKFPLDPLEFSAWASERRLRKDGASRLLFANAKIANAQNP